MSEVLVIKPGLLTTVQDRGRWGFQSRGVSVAGPMDAYAHRLANVLVGNADDAATLEVTWIGPELEFDDERVIAVSGAEFEVAVDGRRVPPDRPAQLQAERDWPSAGGCGAPVPTSRLRAASRCAPVFGSRATHVGSRLGGLDGRALQAGDRLPLSAKGVRPLFQEGYDPLPAGASDPCPMATPWSVCWRVRRTTTSLTKRCALFRRRRIRSVRIRIGWVFVWRARASRHARGADIISDATPMGALQVPASGLPILLMADRQTTGGYPKIATVITADLGLAGQLGPGDTISFAVCSPGEALAALIAQERALLAIEPEAG